MATTYDFQTVTNRRGTGSEKWNLMLEKGDVPDGIVPFSVGDMEIKTAPELVEGLKNYLDTSILGYTAPNDAYFRAVQSWFKRRHKWKIDRDWLVQFDGVVPALFNAVQAFTQPGDGVIVMPPVYYPFFRAANSGGRRAVEVPLLDTADGYQMDYAGLERAAKLPETKLCFLCSPHNPVGKVWREDELRRLGAICRDNGVIVISDEIHMDIVMPGYKHIVYSELGSDYAEHAVVCTAPSKTFNIAGLQCSNIVIPNPVLRKRYVDTYQATGREGVNLLGLTACRIAYEQCEDWFDGLLSVVHANAELVRAFMEETFFKIKVYELEGTYFIWLDFRAWGMGHEELEKFMTEKALFFLDEGYIFGTGGAGFERINLACPTLVLKKALERMRDAAWRAGLE